MTKPVKWRPRKKRREIADLATLQERAKRIAGIQQKRQNVIDKVHLSLRKRRLDKIAVENGRFEKEAKFRQKQQRDAEKKGGEKAMLQVLTNSSSVILSILIYLKNIIYVLYFTSCYK